MTALVSGQAGVAVAVDGDHYFSLHYPDLDRSWNRTAAEAGSLLVGYADIVDLADVSIDEVKRELELECGKDRALQLLLVLLDSNAGDDTRSLAAKCLGQRLSVPAVREFVENRLYSTPLPGDADIPGALRRAGGQVSVSDLLTWIVENQPAIAEARSVWDRVHFLSPEEKAELTFLALESGLFRGHAPSNSRHSAPEKITRFELVAFEWKLKRQLQRELESLRSSHGAINDEVPERLYTVERGDSLWTIAEKHLGNGALYPKIVAANLERFRDGTTITPGEELIVPN